LIWKQIAVIRGGEKVAIVLTLLLETRGKVLHLRQTWVPVSIKAGEILLTPGIQIDSEVGGRLRPNLTSLPAGQTEPNKQDKSKDAAR